MQVPGTTILVNRTKYSPAFPDYCKFYHGNGHAVDSCWFTSLDFLEHYGYNLNRNRSGKEKGKGQKKGHYFIEDE